MLKDILCWEFHVSRFCLFHHDWKAFSFTPWLPYKHYSQAIYVVYRWMITLFFLAYFLKTIIDYGIDYYFQYLTNWSLVILLLHLVWSSVTVTYTFLRVFILKKSPHKPSVHIKQLSKPPGCCGTAVDSTSWYHKVQWVLFTLGTEVPATITLLYWTLLYDSFDGGVDDNNIVTHLLNGLIAYIDLWATGVPVRLYHFYIVVAFGSVYTVFTGIHHAALVIPNITDPIYPVIDYTEHPGSAAIYGLIIPLIVIPIIHLIFYASHLGREAVLFVIRRNCKSYRDDPWRNEAEDNIELKSDP